VSRILLVRHGQSEWNARGQWQGQADPPLTDLGRRQAQIAAELAGSFDLIASSDLQRARDTAETIATAIGVGPVQVDSDLRERHIGEWQGLTRSEIDERYPGYLAERRRPASYESDGAIRARVVPALARLAAAIDGGTALVVAHGGVIYTIEALLGLGFERIPNLGGRWIEITASAMRHHERVLMIDPDTVEASVPGQL